MYWYFLLFLSLFIVVVVVVFYFWQVARLAGGEHSSLSIETGFFFCYLLSYTQGVRVDGPWCDVQAFIHIYICAFCMESLTIHILYMQMGRFDRRARAFCPKIHKNKSRPGNSVPLITHCASTKSWADMTNGLCQKITTNSIIYSYR